MLTPTFRQDQLNERVYPRRRVFVVCTNSTVLALCPLSTTMQAFLTILLWRRWRQCLPPSGFSAVLLGLLSTACVLDVYCQCTAAVQLKDITLSATQLDKTSVIVSLVVLATVLGNFLVSEIQDLVIKRPNRFVAYPFHIGMGDSPMCDSCGTTETIGHILCICPQYDVEREVFRTALIQLDSRQFSVIKILGPWPFASMAQKATKTLLKYLKSTGLGNHV
nr:uncharacterized protein LOC129383839 [Dermacentor andersoni]